jgi:cell division protein FtsI (penicillin-binding protein 3)
VRQVNYAPATVKNDSSNFQYAGLKQDLAQVLNTVKVPYRDDGKNVEELVSMSGTKYSTYFTEKMFANNYMPSLKGLGLKDAVVLCEGMGLKVNIKGKGRVVAQSISVGQSVGHGQLLNIELN